MRKKYNKLFFYLFIVLFILCTINVFTTEYETYGDKITGEIYKGIEEKIFSKSYYIKIKDEKIYCSEEEFGNLVEGKEYEIYWVSNTKDRSGKKHLLLFRTLNN